MILIYILDENRNINSNEITHLIIIINARLFNLILKLFF
jgi:hypothetical protein